MNTKISSEMKTVNSRTETAVSDPVLKNESIYESLYALSELVDKNRLEVKYLMVDAISEYASVIFGMEDWDAYGLAMNIYGKEGSIGLAKKLAEYSDFLHLECFRLKEIENRKVS